MRISDWSSDVCSSDLRSPSSSHPRSRDPKAGRPPPRAGKDGTAASCPSGEGVREKASACSGPKNRADACPRSEEHTSELQSLMRISYAVFCLKKKKYTKNKLKDKL